MWCSKCSGPAQGHCLTEHRVCVSGDLDGAALRLGMFLRDELADLPDRASALAAFAKVLVALSPPPGIPPSGIWQAPTEPSGLAGAVVPEQDPVETEEVGA